MGDATSNRLYGPLIHILDDYSLLNVFSLSRPALFGESDDDDILDGGDWNREWWWHNLVHVCRRWRHIVLESASHLRLSLVCAGGRLTADMLAHSPPFPLIIDSPDQNDDTTAEDEEGTILALQHRDRVRRIRLVGTSIFQTLVNALDGEYPILESLYVMPGRDHSQLDLPETFRAPHLRHLVLGCPRLTAVRNRVSINSFPIIVHIRPNVLLQWLTFMPQLEVLGITIIPFPINSITLRDNSCIRRP